MATGPQVINQAQIDAAIAAEQQRQIALAAATAEQQRLAELAPFAFRVQEVGGNLIDTLTSRGGESAERGIASTQASMEKQVKEVLDPYAAIGGTISGLSTPIVAPAPIYRTIVSTYVDPKTGDTIAIYNDGTTEVISKGNQQKKVVSTYTDPSTGDVIAVYEDGSTSVISKGTVQEEKQAERQSAYDLLYEQFSQYGLGSLVTPLKDLILQGVPASEFIIRLRETPAYQNRFAANKQRIAKGLAALSEAEYIALEDQYQNVMRRYGLPASYYSQSIDPITGISTQKGFEKFIAGDVSVSELEDRIATAQNRILYANPEVSIALKTFYPDITNGDLLAYALDPEQGLAQIKRRITAAEIGSSAVQLGLTTNVTDAEYLARYGVTKEQAQAGYRTAAEILPRASFLGDIYSAQGMGPYTQTTAEREIFNVPGAAEAAQQRKKLTQLEQASFSGQAGTTGGALARERAGAF